MTETKVIFVTIIQTYIQRISRDNFVQLCLTLYLSSLLLGLAKKHPAAAEGFP